MHDDHHQDDHGESSNPWADRINEAYYDGMGADFGRRTRDRINWMCAQAKGDTALDVGCSQGITSILLAREGMNVVGVDIFEPAIAYANGERAKEIPSVQARLTFLCSDLAEVRDAAFDTVILGEVVEHQTNPQKFIRQAAALVSDHGRLVLTVPYGLHPWPDHKSTIFPRDVVDAISAEFGVVTLDVEQGYIRLVADRNVAGSSGDSVSRVVQATERGALEVQNHLHEIAGEQRQVQKKAQGLEKALLEASEKLSAMRAKTAGLESEHSEKLLRMSLMESSLSESRERLQTMDAMLLEKAQQQSRSSDRVEDMVRQLATLRAVSEHSSRSIIELEKVRAKLEHDSRALEKENRDLESRLAELDRQSAIAALQLQSAKQEGEQVAESYARLRESDDVLQEKLRGMEDECHALIDRLASEQEQYRTESDRLKDLNSKLEQRVIACERAKAAAENGAAEMSGRLSKLSLKSDLLASQLRDTGSAASAEAEALNARIAALSDELDTAQHKRHGHFQHLKAERERSRKLIEHLQRLHAENELYRNSLALRLGRAVLGATSVRGIFGLPGTLWSIASAYRARKVTGIPTSEFLVPPVEPVVLPPFKRSLPRLAPSPAAAHAGREKSAMAAITLSALDWSQAGEVDGIPVMSVLDEFSRACFSPQANLVEPRPDNWEGLVELYSPKFLFVESSWKGNYGSWQYRVSSYANPPGAELQHMAKGFRDRGLPTVFWNKEDPVHFENFIAAAGNFDYVFTTASEAVSRYQEKTKAKVGVLQFAAEESLHNPIDSSRRNDKVCFAGSFYANRFADRRDDQLMLLDAASKFDLDIYDRNFVPAGSAKSDFAFPERFDKFVRGRLPYTAIGRAYREYRVFLNVNSVIDSPTMFSRRVFELLACGTPVVSTWSRGTEETFGQDLIWHVRNREEAEEALQVLLSNDDEWRRRSLMGIRAVLNQHTYRHRFNQVCEAIGVQRPVHDPFSEVLVVSEVENEEELSSVVAGFRRQELASDTKAKLLVLGRGELSSVDVEGVGDYIETVLPVHEVVNMAGKTERLGMLGVMSPNALYGRHYLQDMLNAARYSGAAVCGKGYGEDAVECRRGVALDPRSLVLNIGMMGSEDVRRVLVGPGEISGAGAIGTYASDSANFLRLQALSSQEERAQLLKRVEI